MKLIEVTKLQCVRHRQVEFCVLNYEYFNNHSEFLKWIRQCLGSPAVMGLPENRLVWLRTSLESCREKLKTKASYNSLCV